MHLVLFCVFTHVEVIFLPALIRGALRLEIILGETHVVLLN
jgi:hypothetical protein